MSQIGTTDSESGERDDTERLVSWADFPHLLEPVPVRWYQRNVAAVAAGCIGVIGLVALVIAVIVVSGGSTHPAPIHSGATVSTAPRSTSPTPSAAPPPTAEAPPTVAATAATENTPAPAAEAPPATPAPISRPSPDAAPRWWHRLYPHRYPSGQ